MAKRSGDLQFVCSNCGRTEAKWLGRCPDCGSWNSFEEELIITPSKGAKPLSTDEEPVRLEDVVVDPQFRYASGISELDRVLGGGVMKGSSVLIGGEPGIGKSTLMLQLLQSARNTSKVLYVSGEESPSQVKMRAQRLGLHLSKINIFCDTRLEVLEKVLPSSKASLVVIDSLQTLSSDTLPSPAGSVNQIRHCSNALVSLAKRLGISLFFVAHVTKEGTIAGPKVIEHLVDTVLYFDQLPSGIRLIRAAKNRFGSVDEIGLFSMDEKGLHPVANPASFFLSDRAEGPLPPGVAYTAVAEGTRSFLVEVQALTVPAKSGFSRIFSDRIDSARVTRIAAVLERHAGLRLSDQDIYVNVGGGMKVGEVAVELALALALYSALTRTSLPKDLVSFGELSLSGEIRPVGFIQRREKTAKELGFTRSLVSKASKQSSLTQYGARTIRDALDAVREMH